MSEAVKLFKAKVKELAAFVESNEAYSYLSEDFLARLTELRELTEIIKIDLVRANSVTPPILVPNSVYVAEAPKENLAAFVAEAAVVETPKAKAEKKEVVVEVVAEPVVVAEVVKEPVVEEVNGTDKEPSSEAGTETQAKAVKPRAAKAST